MEARNHRPQIVEAISRGIRTSPELAVALGATTARIAVALQRLADLGVVVRVRRRNDGRMGRPPIEWALVKEAVQ